MTKGTILLAAGGTGGHLFPGRGAGARADRARLDASHLATDDRAERFAGQFPGRRRSIRSPSATIGSTQPGGAGAVPSGRSGAACGRRPSVIRAHQAGGRGRLRRLSDPAAALCRDAARRADADPRAERGDGPRQQGAGRRASTAIAGGFLPAGRRARSATRSVATGNPVRPAVLEAAEDALPAVAAATSRSGCWSSAAARARSSSPMSCRRRSRCCPRRSARGCSVTQQARAEDLDAVQRGLCGARRAGRGLALLHRHGGAHRRGASRDLAAPAPRPCRRSR